MSPSACAARVKGGQGCADDRLGRRGSHPHLAGGRRLSCAGWRMDVLAELLDNPRPELFRQQIFVWTGKKLTRRQTEQFAHWHEQGFSITLHGQS